MRNRHFTMILAIAVLLIGTSAFGQRMRPTTFPVAPPPSLEAINPGPLDFGPCMFVLQLSEDQKAQFKQIIAAEQPTIKTLATALKNDHDVLSRTAAGKETCAIGAAYLQVTVDQKALADEMKLLHDKLAAVLTAEQKSRLDGCLAALARMGQRP